MEFEIKTPMDEVSSAETPRQRLVDELVIFCAENAVDRMALEFARLGASTKMREFLVLTYLRMPSEQIKHFKLLPTMLGYAELGISPETAELLSKKSIEMGNIRVAKRAIELAGRELTAEEIKEFMPVAIEAVEARRQLTELEKKCIPHLERIMEGLEHLGEKRSK